MKKFGVLLFLLLAFEPAASQQLSTAEFRYLSERKEMGTGLALSIILPGAGHFYADAPEMGTIFAAVEVGFTVLYFIERGQSQDNPDRPTTQWISLSLAGLAKLIDILSVPSSVNAYNDGLAARIGVTVSDRGLGLRFTF